VTKAQSRVKILRSLRHDEDRADDLAAAGKFSQANVILREVTKRLSMIYDATDPGQLRALARDELGECK
jgi:hypothetical protein